MIDTILFDFDGTMMDTNDAIIQSWQHTFRTLTGHEEDVDKLAATFGEPLGDSMARFFPDVPVSTSIGIYRDFQKDHFLNLIHLFPGVEETVLTLKEREYRLGIVTSRLIRTTTAALHKYDLESCFDVIITPEDTQKHKPDPEPALAALEKLHTVPERAIMLGDTLYDLQCAKNAGVWSVLAGWSFALRNQDDLGADEPDFRISDCRQLMDLVEKL